MAFLLLIVIASLVAAFLVGNVGVVGIVGVVLAVFSPVLALVS